MHLKHIENYILIDIVKIEKTSADMIVQFPQRPFYSPCKLRAIKQQIAKLRTHKNNQIHLIQLYLQVDNVQH